MEVGANCLVAPTHLFSSDEEKKRVIQNAVDAAEDKAFVCGGILAPGDKTEFSGGTLSYDSYYASIKKEAAFLSENASCAVLFLLGFTSLAEAKYAVYAAKEVSDLPLCVLMDFKNESKLSDGFDAASVVITLQALGIQALGVSADSCDDALDILLDMKEFASVPLFVVPGADSFITPTEYAEYAPDFINNKCVMFGAGKGTDLRFTAQIAKQLWQLEPFMPDFPTVHAVCGKNQTYFMDFNNRVIGKNKVLLELDMEKMTKTEDADEIIRTLTKQGTPPVCFKTKDIEVLERAVKLYPGRAAVRSDEYGEITAKEYGAVVLSPDKED